MENTFDDLELDEHLLRGIYAYGFEKPSSIQTKSIPIIKKGKDIIAQAQSGTGKTGAFVIGSLSNIDLKINSTQILIISPTRELSAQIINVTKELSTYMIDLKILKVIGGTNIKECIDSINTSPHIIVGTPGRILDMIEKRVLNTQQLKMLIFDEAD